jgi:four helix bundle protein
MGDQGFRSLVAYRRAASVSDELWAVVASWDSLARWTVGVQLVRAADSVAANLAEAYGRWSYPDRLRQLAIARGSACELEHWILRAESRGLPLPKDGLSHAKELGRLINGLRRSWSA